MKKLLCFVSFIACCFLLAAPPKKPSIPSWNPLPHLAMGKTECITEENVAFMRITTTEDKQKHFMGNKRFFEAKPGSTFTLKVRVRSGLDANHRLERQTGFLDYRRA